MLHTLFLWSQWPGAVLGIIGALWVTGKTNKARFWGFGLWVLSDVFWLAYAYEIAAYGLFLSFAYFTVTSARGMWSNRLRLTVVEGSIQVGTRNSPRGEGLERH